MPGEADLYLWTGTIWIPAAATGVGDQKVVIEGNSVPRADMYEYDDATTTWHEKHHSVTGKRMTAAGQVVAEHSHIAWIITNPSGNNALFEITNDLDGLGAVVVDFYNAVRTSVPIL